MRIASKPPDPPDGFAIMSQCTFCDEFASKFVIITHFEDHCVMCATCAHDVAEALLNYYPELADSRA